MPMVSPFEVHGDWRDDIKLGNIGRINELRVHDLAVVRLDDRLDCKVQFEKKDAIAPAVENSGGLINRL